MRTGYRPLIILAAILLAASSSRGESPTLKIGSGQGRVTVTGVRSRHTVLFFGAGVGRYSHTPLLVHYAQAIADDDGDGKVDFKLWRAPADAVWICIDLEDGDYAVATPSGTSVTELRVPPQAWRAGGDHLDLNSGYLDAVVVRPHVGAWYLRIADGGPNDADGHTNGALRLRLDRMVAITGKQSGPPVVTGRDVIFAIDCNTLNVDVRQAE